MAHSIAPTNATPTSVVAQIETQYRAADIACYNKEKELEKEHILVWQKSVESYFTAGRENPSREDSAVFLACLAAQSSVTGSLCENVTTNTWKKLTREIFKKDPKRAMEHVQTFLSFAEAWTPTDVAIALEKEFSPDPRTSGARARSISFNYEETLSKM